MIEKRRSKIQGWGVYATQPIPKNKRIIHYAGEKISNQESLQARAALHPTGHIWCFKLTNRTVIDAGVGGNVARFINHSCRPNCYIHINDGHHLDPRRQTDPQGRGADLQLQHRRRGADQVPLPPRVPEPAVTGLPAPPSHVFYLHGFASSPGSTKASYFADRLLAHGVRLRCPDFNVPDFATMTMTRMLEQLSSELDALGPGLVTLMGSSLGGTLAILAAERWPRVDRLVLLAPAVMFAKPGHHLLPPERLAAWRREGAMSFFHYAYGEERPLNVSFYEDSLHYNPFDAAFQQQTLIFQGLRDASVDFRTVERFASMRPNVTLSLLEDDHSLIVSLPRIWQDVQPFLDL